MTTPSYPFGWPAKSKVRGDAAAWSSSAAWNVNFNNGNVNNNHRNNQGFALAVRRAGECQGENRTEVTLHSLYEAWRRARRQKVPSHNQLRFDTRWSSGLLALQGQLNAGTWCPRKSTCFVATRPKAREIHAPDFADRVVHHWLVPQLEAVYEPQFIHDSYANRAGKGSHAAVERAQAFARQVNSGSQGPGWYLQLDIHNFFNSIHCPTLWAMLKRKLSKAALPQQALIAAYALLRRPPLSAGVEIRATTNELAQIPQHKRLANAEPQCGLPIGNLSSQFFANVYLDALDQFVKQKLRARRYLRYVDDFVLFHHDRKQLIEWQRQIEAFLAQSLRLRLKPDIKLRQLTDGLDFLGYVIYPTHTLVRKRVVTHFKQALAAWAASHVRGKTLRGTPADFERIRTVIASYAGHLQHASSRRLMRRIRKKFPWIDSASKPRRFPTLTYASRQMIRTIKYA